MTPHDKIKDNNFLCNLDMDSATREQKIDWLCQIIKNETEKPENEQDMELISECSDYLRELSEEEVSFSEEELQKGLAKIKLSNQESNVAILPRKRYKKKLVKAVIIFAATFVVLFSGTTVAAKTQGYSNAWEFVSLNVERIFKMNPGDTIGEGNVTLIKREESIIYASMEEMIKAENYNILYPSKLPDNVYVQRIIHQYMSDGSMMLSFQSNDPNFSLSISENFTVSEKDMQELEEYITPNNITFFIDSIGNELYQAIAHINGNEYQIIYKNKDVLIMILDSMKGIRE